MRQAILDKALAAVRSEPRIGPHFRPDHLEVDPEGVLTVEAEVDSLAQKRLALERFAGIPGVKGIVDRLHVRPATPMRDGGIADDLRRRLAEEPAFFNLDIVERRLGHAEVVRGVPDGSGAGRIEFEVENGIVTLDGAAPSLASKRLMGAMVWWNPGVRDVINGVAVEPPEEDAPIQIEEAVRLVLEKNPFVDADQIRIGVRGAVVRLTGLVKSPGMREIAEADAWRVFAVDNVLNEIGVRA
jgi:osmotically-inducible protein OsmY